MRRPDISELSRRHGQRLKHPIKHQVLVAEHLPSNQRTTIDIPRKLRRRLTVIMQLKIVPARYQILINDLSKNQIDFKDLETGNHKLISRTVDREGRNEESEPSKPNEPRTSKASLHS
ncbi:hypothetical protein NPIL_647541 [Nephila pilipes]|uniref:Uncharacterized protein n=1 Tax=Nephila pilipes TaxID=299642 RepID=A0A8X6P9J3_NEPPI|nr:hypothetical protein NPIL_647541 [Nephila pilipes]